MGRIRYSDRVDFNARQQEVAYISGELKTLARNLEVPVICLSQLNRNVDKAENKIPSLADLRESGAIEQDADIVMLMYREDYYTDIGLSVKKGGWKNGGKEQEEEQPKPKLSDEEKAKTGDVSDVTISIAKNRNGQIGSFHLLFQKAFLYIVYLCLGVVIDHQIKIAEGLEEVLLGATAPFAHTFEDIGAHPKLTRENLGYYRRLGIGSGVQHQGRGREGRNHLMTSILATERILPDASEAKT